jgi:hypothetical protein
VARVRQCSVSPRRAAGVRAGPLVRSLMPGLSDRQRRMEATSDSARPPRGHSVSERRQRPRIATSCRRRRSFTGTAPTLSRLSFLLGAHAGRSTARPPGALPASTTPARATGDPAGKMASSRSAPAPRAQILAGIHWDGTGAGKIGPGRFFGKLGNSPRCGRVGRCLPRVLTPGFTGLLEAPNPRLGVG